MAIAKDLTPQFRRAVQDSVRGCVLKPLLRSYLFDADFPERFSVTFDKEDHVRRPDGVFHPSTHPLWPERQLYYYLTEPDGILIEPKEYMSTLSVIIGKAVHGFIGVCLDHMGVRLTAKELRAEGFDCDDLGEPKFSDPVTGSGGSTDGILRLTMWDQPDLTRQVFELKTSNLLKLRQIQDLDLEAFKETWPEYWAQQQEYLRISGFGLSVVIMLALGYPWEIREFHIPRDHAWQHQVREKYQRVRTAVEHSQLPLPCCGPKSKEAKACPARAVCPVGSA